MPPPWWCPRSPAECPAQQSPLTLRRAEEHHEHFTSCFCLSQSPYTSQAVLVSQRTENPPGAPPRQQHQGRALSPVVTALHKPSPDTQIALSTSEGGQRRNSTFPLLLPYLSSASSPSTAQAEQHCLGTAGVAAGTRGPPQACHFSHPITLLFPGQSQASGSVPQDTLSPAPGLQAEAGAPQQC